MSIFSKNKIKYNLIAYPLIASFVIVVLVTANAYFTFSGAILFINEWVFALLFAIAVQFSIAFSLIAIPYISGFKKIITFVLYSIGLTLSMFSAYTFIYNTSIGNAYKQNHDLVFTKLVSDYLSKVRYEEKECIKTIQSEIQDLKRAADEEAEYGIKSNKGPGKGKIYIHKKEQYEIKIDEYNLIKESYAKFKVLSDEIFTKLDESVDHNKIITMISKVKEFFSCDASKIVKDDKIFEHISNIETPLERALNGLFDIKNLSSQTVMSILWAGIFDIIALFIGIIRYFLIQPHTPLTTKILNVKKKYILFRKSLKDHELIEKEYNIERQYQLEYLKERELELERHKINSKDELEIKSFLSSIIATGIASNSKDALNHLQEFIELVKPLNLRDKPESIGFFYSDVGIDSNNESKNYEQDTSKYRKLLPLIGFLVQHEVLINNVDKECYIVINTLKTQLILQAVAKRKNVPVPELPEINYHQPKGLITQ